MLQAEGLPLDPIAEELGKDLDPFDLICHVAFDAKPLTVVGWQRSRSTGLVEASPSLSQIAPPPRAMDRLRDGTRS